MHGMCVCVHVHTLARAQAYMATFFTDMSIPKVEEIQSALQQDPLLLSCCLNVPCNKQPYEFPPQAPSSPQQMRNSSRTSMPGIHWACTKQLALCQTLLLHGLLHPHFTDEATMAWRDTGTCMKSHSPLGAEPTAPDSRWKGVYKLCWLPLC